MMSKAINMKYLTRRDRPDKRVHSWIVQIYVDGIQICKSFADKAHGGKAKGLLAATDFRDGMVKKHNIVMIDGVRNQPFQKSGKGVSFSMRARNGRDYPVFIAHWIVHIDGKSVRRQSVFSIRRHGFNGARKKAKKLRADKLKELYG